MQFTLLEIDSINWITYILGAIISWVIFYYTIKTAVKNGMREASEEKNITQTKPEKQLNSKQIELQNKYDRGEISFEEYKKQWDF